MPLETSLKSSDVTDLIIKAGAYVSRPKDMREKIACRWREDSPWFAENLCIEDEVDCAGIEETLAIMFDDANGGGEHGSLVKSRPVCLLKCSESVLYLVTEAISRHSASLIHANET